MIVVFLSDPFLRATVRRAALPEEDVFWQSQDVREALERGFPRLAIGTPDEPGSTEDARGPASRHVPVLELTGATIRAWQSQRRASGFAVSRIDDHGIRLRQLIDATAGSPTWVDAFFRDLSRTAGTGLPRASRGLGRRVLEHPSRYEDLHSLAELTGLTRGALKARFRRRGLPSPYTYLRWFRALAACRILADPETTTERAAYRMGLHSSGNFCRYVQEVSGLAPTEMRKPMGRTLLVTRFAGECFQPEHVARWKSLGDLFLEGAAA